MCDKASPISATSLDIDHNAAVIVAPVAEWSIARRPPCQLTIFPLWPNDIQASAACRAHCQTAAVLDAEVHVIVAIAAECHLATSCSMHLVNVRTAEKRLVLCGHRSHLLRSLLLLLLLLLPPYSVRLLAALFGNLHLKVAPQSARGPHDVAHHAIVSLIPCRAALRTW